MKNKHSRFGPSSAERWMNCPGSINLCSGLPNVSTIHAVEGTVAHKLAEELITDRTTPTELSARVGQTVHQEGFDIKITDEMVNSVVEYQTVINQDILDMKPLDSPEGMVLKSEIKIHALKINGELYGTADFVLFRKKDKLVVYDFKYGKGVAVEVERNKQLAIYALGFLDNQAEEDAAKSVELVIIQPRAAHIDGSVRRWTAPAGWLEAFRSELKAAVNRACDPGAELLAGKWCRWCPAKSGCPAMFSAVQDQAKVDFSIVTVPTVGALPDSRTMPIEKVALALDWEDSINSWYESLKLRVRETLETGGNVPGYKLVEGRSNRRWIDEAKVVEKFKQSVGEDKLFERKLLSPAKLEKIVGKGKLEESGLTEKPPASKAIAKDNDPRPVARSSAAQDFSVIEKK